MSCGCVEVGPVRDQMVRSNHGVDGENGGQGRTNRQSRWYGEHSKAARRAIIGSKGLKGVRFIFQKK